MEKDSTATQSKEYKGPAPRMAALGGAAFSFAVMAPFTWVANGLINLGFDKAFDKIPFKKDSWTRFKRMDVLSAGILSGLVLYDAYGEGKKAYRGAKNAEHQFNKLSIEHDLYREQLVEAKIKPKDVTFVREVDLRTIKFADKPTTSHAEKIAAEKAAASEASPTI